MKILHWGLRLARPLWRQFLLATFLGLATIASGLGLLATSAFLIARAALQPSIADLQLAIVAVRFLGIARGVLRYTERYLSHNLTFQLLAEIRIWFYRELEPLAPAALSSRHSGDLLARIIDDIETLQFLFLRVLQPPAIAALGAAVLVVILAPIDGTLALAWLLLLAFAGLGIPLLANLIGRPLHERLAQQGGRLKEKTVELIQGMADLLAYGGAQAQLEALHELDRERTELQRRLHRLEAAVEAGLRGATQAAPVAVLWLALPLLQEKSISGVGLAVLVVAALASFELVTPLTEALPAFEASLAAGKRLFAITESMPPIQEPTRPLKLKAGASHGLQIRDLTFKYTAKDAPVLDGINLEINDGHRLALVGPSGAGKSSLINLLLRFWDYQQGSIRLGGHELNQLTSADARSMLSVMSQRTMLFSSSLRQNLLLAKPGATQDELIAALEAAGAGSLLKLLPQGLDTPLGEWGWQLSAGQRQRVALARTLLQDRPLLLLDEPTANLDPLAEASIMSDLLAATQGITTLLITHRLTGLANFSQIVVLANGQIQQRGSHAELIQQAGIYRRMWQLQVERWQVELDLSINRDSAPPAAGAAPAISPY